jgi:hypothetical protein
MKSEHLSIEQMSQYHGRTLVPRELLAVDNHMASCRDCYKLFTRSFSIVPEKSEALKNELQTQISEESFHLNFDEQMAPYVDGKVEEIEREIIESHLALCAQCAEDLHDLQEFKYQLSQASVNEPTSFRQSSAREKIASLWAQPTQWRRLRIAAMMLAVAVVAGVAVALLWHARFSNQRAKLITPEPAYRGAQEQSPNINAPAAPAPESVDNSSGISAAQNSQGQPLPTPVVRDRQPDAQIVTVLNDGGGQILIDSLGRVSGLESLPVELRQSVKTALTARQLQRPSILAELSTKPGGLLGGSGERDTFALSEPFGKVVESDHPTFRWHPLAGATRYTVTVYDSNLQRVMSSEALAATKWTPTRALARGMTYSWQVSAVRDGKVIISPKPPVANALFRVLGGAESAAIERAKRTHGNSHLAMGVLYWKAGLVDDAEREFQALAQANPDSQMAKRLLRDAQSLRHL